MATQHGVLRRRQNPAPLLIGLLHGIFRFARHPHSLTPVRAKVNPMTVLSHAGFNATRPADLPGLRDHPRDPAYRLAGADAPAHVRRPGLRSGRELIDAAELV